jgi:hypothetical protein
VAERVERVALAGAGAARFFFGVVFWTGLAFGGGGATFLGGSLFFSARFFPFVGGAIVTGVDRGAQDASNDGWNWEAFFFKEQASVRAMQTAQNQWWQKSSYGWPSISCFICWTKMLFWCPIGKSGCSAALMDVEEK